MSCPDKSERIKCVFKNYSLERPPKPYKKHINPMDTTRNLRLRKTLNSARSTTFGAMKQVTAHSHQNTPRLTFDIIRNNTQMKVQNTCRNMNKDVLAHVQNMLRALLKCPQISGHFVPLVYRETIFGIEPFEHYGPFEFDEPLRYTPPPDQERKSSHLPHKRYLILHPDAKTKGTGLYEIFHVLQHKKWQEDEILWSNDCSQENSTEHAMMDDPLSKQMHTKTRAAQESVGNALDQLIQGLSEASAVFDAERHTSLLGFRDLISTLDLPHREGVDQLPYKIMRADNGDAPPSRENMHRLPTPSSPGPVELGKFEVRGSPDPHEIRNDHCDPKSQDYNFS